VSELVTGTEKMFLYVELISGRVFLTKPCCLKKIVYNKDIVSEKIFAIPLISA